MCGIAGIAGARSPELLRSMTAALIHRGPDDEGFFADGDVALGMRRLSILDLSTGRQPISGEEGRATVELFTAIYRANRDRRAIKFPLTAE